MTFELSPEASSARDAARALAQQLADVAHEIDRTSVVPPAIARDVDVFGERELLPLTVAVEEIAVASAAAAVGVAMARGGRPLGLTGLRGASELEATPRARLVLAAAALGIGRAALDESLAELRRASAVTSPTSGSGSSGPGEPTTRPAEKPHWVVADVATDLEAARLLTYKAAATGQEADIALARLMASQAATRAVDAAIRVVGPAALAEGSRIDRLARDVRAVSVLAGTEEEQRAAAAEGLLPHLA